MVERLENKGEIHRDRKSALVSMLDVVSQEPPETRSQVRDAIWTFHDGVTQLLPYLQTQLTQDRHGRYTLDQPSKYANQLQAYTQLLVPLFHVLEPSAESPFNIFIEASTKLEQQRFASLRVLSSKPEWENWFVADGVLVTFRNDMKRFDAPEYYGTSTIQFQPFQYMREKETREERKQYDNARLQITRKNFPNSEISYEISAWAKQPDRNSWSPLYALNHETTLPLGYEQIGNSMAYLYTHLLEKDKKEK